MKLLKILLKILLVCAIVVVLSFGLLVGCVFLGRKEATEKVGIPKELLPYDQTIYRHNEGPISDFNALDILQLTEEQMDNIMVYITGNEYWQPLPMPENAVEYILGMDYFIEACEKNGGDYQGIKETALSGQGYWYFEPRYPRIREEAETKEYWGYGTYYWGMLDVEKGLLYIGYETI